ncbi:MAG: response regulator [Candidatus Sumerlaeota bacterium]|nr:response regulator [Candidatus Sumerlaeota bacterium]
MTQVLIIDDEPGAIKVAQQYVTDAGYEVLTAASSAQGLALFHQHLPPVVITDFKMPGMNGLDLLKKIKGIKPDTVVVVITAYGSEEVAAEAIRWGANDYLIKPFSFGDLSMTLFRYRHRIQENLLGALAPRITTREVLDFNLATRLEDIEAATQLMSERIRIFVNDPDAAMSLRFGVGEMLTNALEHGNLGITHEEKKAAFDADAWEELLAERLADPARSARRIRAHFEIGPQGMMCAIEDEGAGFDWKSLPRSLKAETMHLDMGHGIQMTRQHFDDVSYSDGGRRVTLKKVF